MKMKETNNEQKLRCSNLILAIVLGVVALAGTLIPYFYLNGAVVTGG